MAVQPATRRFTVDEYHRMGEARILFPDERVELLEGEVAGVSEAWLVDLPASTVEVYRSPEGGVYREVRRAGQDETVSPVAFPDVGLPLRDVLR